MEQTNNKPGTNSSGPNFSMTLADNDSTFSFINKVASQVYPEGKVLVKGTTASQRGFEEKTLVSHNVESIMAGNALSRNPAMASVAYDRLTTSSLESHLAFGADFSLAEEKDGRKAFEYPNPDFSGDKEANDKSLSGPAAFKSAISQSVLGTGYAPGFFQQKAYGYSNSLVANTTNDDGTTVDGGNYQIDPDALGIGPAKNGYPAALISDLSDQEKEIYINAIQTVNNNVKFNRSNGEISTAGFSISAFEKDKQNLRSNYQEAAGNINDQGKDAGSGTSYYRTLPDQFLELTDPSKFYPSITLLKMLVEMSDPNGLDLTIGFGFSRGQDLVHNNAVMTENTDGKKTITDHAFGRAIDIYAVGQKNVSGSSLTVNATNYEKCFTLLMQKIALLPKYFQPDEIVISKAMYAKYVSDSSQKKMAFMQAFPGLSKYVNVNQDGANSTTHDGHIHLGFHWTRAGNAAVFLGSTTSGGTNLGNMGTVANSVFKTTADMTQYLDMGREVFTSAEQKIDPVDLGKIMATTGIFNIEEIAVFCGLAERESNSSPYRGDGAGPLLALGMFQNELYNFIDGRISSFSLWDFYIPEGTSTRFADQNGKRTLKGWQLYFKKETAIKQSDLKARADMTWDISKVDPVFWIPLNQIAIAAQVARIYKPNLSSSSSKSSQFYKEEGLRSAAIARNLWTNWGDGAWGDQSAFQSWGALTNVKRDTVKKVYEALGGTWNSFIAWALGGVSVPGALCEAFTVKQVQEKSRLSKDGQRTIYGPPYRSFWDVFIWVYDLFDEAINYFTTEEEKKQFTDDRWGASVKVFAPGIRKTVFTKKIVEDIIGQPYNWYRAYNAPRR